MTVENITGPIAHHAEGPVWAPSLGGLRWVDGEAGDLLSLSDDGVSRQHVDDEYLAFIRPRISGGFVAIGARTLYLSDSAEGPAAPVGRLLDNSSVRMNDGCCDPGGRLFAGSMAYDAAPGGANLHLIDTDLTVSTVLRNVTVSNGLGFSSDGSRAYYVDTMTHRIDAFDVVDGRLERQRPLVEVAPEHGLPDGLTVAADDSVWVALWGGAAVHGYDAAGTLIERIELPVPQVSACTFGGDDLGTLYITTSAQGLAPDHKSMAGSLFAVDLGVRGLPVLPFAG